ncbi:hypothetical protein ILYODFUR_031565 [Ilyodon furcidens]|uniref:Uncharacterized protein n=1 Tax=Ilyodon furcidens TaxID=33524 RepID=A0ABV0SQR0_9TELE
MGRGRPTINIPFESIEIYLLNGFKVQKIAELFGVGHQTIRRRMQSNGLRMSDMYSAMSDQEMDAVIAEIHQSHPNTGYRMMKSFLHARGLLVQITRVRDSLKRVDPIGNEVRAFGQSDTKTEAIFCSCTKCNEAHRWKPQINTLEICCSWWNRWLQPFNCSSVCCNQQSGIYCVGELHWWHQQVWFAITCAL